MDRSDSRPLNVRPACSRDTRVHPNTLPECNCTTGTAIQRDTTKYNPGIRLGIIQRAQYLDDGGRCGGVMTHVKGAVARAQRCVGSVAAIVLLRSLTSVVRGRGGQAGLVEKGRWDGQITAHVADESRNVARTQRCRNGWVW